MAKFTLDEAGTTMLAEDIQWALAGISGIGSAPRGARSFLSLLLAPIWIRIAWEGTLALQEGRLNSLVPHSVPSVAALQSRSTLHRARNWTKVTDSAGGLRNFQDALTEYRNHHQQRFIGRAWKPLRFAERDLGLVRDGNQVIGTTLFIHMLLGIDANLIGQAQEKEMRTRSTQLGSDVGDVLRQLQSVLNLDQCAPMDWSDCAISTKDVRSEHYLLSRFGFRLPSHIRWLLLLTECQVGLCSRLLTRTSASAPNATVRAAFVIGYHSIRALTRVHRQSVHIKDARIADELGALLASPDVRRLMQLGSVRERFIHYRQVEVAARGLNATEDPVRHPILNTEPDLWETLLTIFDDSIKALRCLGE